MLGLFPPPLGGGLGYPTFTQVQWRAGSDSALLATLPPGPLRSPDSEPTVANRASK